MFDIRIGRRILGFRYDEYDDACAMAVKLAYAFPGMGIEVVERVHSGNPPYRLVETVEAPVRVAP